MAGLTNVLNLNFETAEQHKKGMDTEDAALRLLAASCKSLGMELMQRVLPPMRSGVGECDAIVFSDAGILLVEVKRIGGNILLLNETDPQLRVEKGESTVKIENPVQIVRKKAVSLQQFIHDSPDWRSLNELYQKAGISVGIPVFPLLCFGPSTGVEESQINDPNLLLANTRTLKNALTKFLAGKPTVIGGYGHSKTLAHRWGIQGVLKVFRKPGFIRAFPVKAFGQLVDFVNVASIEGRKTGSMTIAYRDRRKKGSTDVTAFVFETYEHGSRREFEVSQGTQFKWKAGG